MNSLLPSTVKYLQNTSLQYRKKMGQYFTPTHVTDIIFKHLTVKNEDIVLDPAVGTGELLHSVYKRNPSTQLIGFDVDDNILNVAASNIPSGVFKNHSLFNSVPEEMLKHC
jgi:type I restriction-modification system DNA methylase subunit